MRVRAVILAAALMLAPLAARAADLAVWWDEARYPAEDLALAELVRQEDGAVPERIEAAIAQGRPPDFMFAINPAPSQGKLERWAAEGLLVDLTDAVGGLADLFDEDVLALPCHVLPG